MLKLTNRYYFVFVIFLLGILLRTYRILDFPVQLNHDEVSQLYDAISIAQTHKDIYGNFLPTIFTSVNDFKSPFYTYITSLFFLIFGGGEITIKLPGLIFGSMMIIAVYFLALKLLKSQLISLVACFLTAVAPFDIFFSRKSFENVAGLFLMALGFIFLLMYIQKASKRWLFMAACFLAAAQYTYFSHAIIIPILLACFLFIFRKHFLKNLKQTKLLLLLFVLLSLPLLFIIITNPRARYRSHDVFITQDPNLGRSIDYNKNENFNFFFRNKAIVDFSFKRYLDQFNINYLFGNGLEFTHQGPLDMGPLLFIQLPFFLFGIVYLIKLNTLKEERLFMLTWILIGMIPSGLTFEPYSPHRSIMVFTMLNIISAIGLYYFFTSLKGLSKNNIAVRVVSIFICFVFFINYLYFLHMYFVNLSFERSQDIHYPFKQVAQFAWGWHDQVNQIVFDPLFGETAPVIGTAAHYYLAYYGGYPPAKFQKEYKKGTKEREMLFDKFSIRKIDWRVDQNSKNTLFIGSLWSLPIEKIDKSKIIKIFYFYNHQEAFYAVKL